MPQDLMFGATWSLPQLLIVLLLVVLLFGKGKVSDLMGDVAKGIKASRRACPTTISSQRRRNQRRPRARRNPSTTNPSTEAKTLREQRRRLKPFRSLLAEFFEGDSLICSISRGLSSF